MSDITPRDRQKALEAEKVLDELLGSIPDREPFREVRARLIEAEALISAIAEGVELPAKSPAFHDPEDSFDEAPELGRAVRKQLKGNDG